MEALVIKQGRCPCTPLGAAGPQAPFYACALSRLAKEGGWDGTEPSLAVPAPVGRREGGSGATGWRPQGRARCRVISITGIDSSAGFKPPAGRGAGPALGFGLRIYRGMEAAGYAGAFWRGLDDAARRVMLWDVPENERAAMLPQCWERADCVILAEIGERLVAATWASRIGPQSNCAMIHFCFAREARGMALEIARAALERLFAATVCQSLIGLIPAKFGHALNFVEKLGFERGARLKGACPIYGKFKSRICDGVIVTLNRKEYLGA